MYRAEVRVVAGDAEPTLMQIRLAEHQRPGLLEQPHRGRILGGHEVREQGRPPGGAGACRVQGVLDGQGDPVQRAGDVPGRLPLIDALSFGQHLLPTGQQKGVQCLRIIQRLDTVQIHLCQFTTTQLSPTDRRGLFCQGHVHLGPMRPGLRQARWGNDRMRPLLHRHDDLSRELCQHPERRPAKSA